VAFRLFPRDGALAQSPLILPPEGAIIRNAVDDYLVSLVLAGRRPAFETVALPLARGLILESDALWLISRGVVAADLERGDLVFVPTDARYLTGAVGLTHRQVGTDHPAPIASCAAPTPPASARASPRSFGHGAALHRLPAAETETHRQQLHVLPLIP